jgi:hypothetical protein
VIVYCRLQAIRVPWATPIRWAIVHVHNMPEIEHRLSDVTAASRLCIVLTMHTTSPTQHALCFVAAAATDELSLTLQLLSAAAALTHSNKAAQASSPPSPQLVLPNSATATAAATPGPQLRPKSTTPIPQGPTTAPSAEAAQEAALPAVVPAPGTGTVTAAGRGGVTAAQSTAAVAAGAGRQGLGADADGVAGAQGSVEVHYSSHLTLLDAANRQATFM